MLPVLVGMAIPADAGQVRIMLRATALLPDPVQRVLTEIGEATEVTLPAKEAAEPILRAHCGGSVSDFYTKQAGELSETTTLLAVQPEDRQVRLPPCVMIKRNPSVKVDVGDDLDSILDRFMGIRRNSQLWVCKKTDKGNKISDCARSSAYDAIAARNGGAEAGLDHLAPNKVLGLPFLSRPTAITLKENYDAEQAKAKLLAAARSTDEGEGLFSVIEAAGDFDLVTPLAADDERLSGSRCSADPKPGRSDWPFDRVEVGRAVADAAAYLEGRTTEPTVIRIADTGAIGVGKDDGFPRRFLEINRAEREGSRYDLDSTPNGFSGDVYGIDAENGGDIAPKNHLDRLHGSEVADLALGGSGFWSNSPTLPRFVHLTFSRLFSSQWSPPGTVRINPDMLIRSLSTTPPKAGIVNFSIGSPNPFSSFKSYLEKASTSRQLVVIAAGNEEKDLASDPSFPASYAHTDNGLLNSMLVVGAHDPADQITRFSNRSREYVDLLAPGCLIPKRFGDKPDDMLNGTSAAAPLVSFTAALLRSWMGSASNNSEIRRRLQATTRYISPEVADAVRFGGVLDMVAALRMFDDVIRLRNGKYVYGRWIEPTRWLICNDKRRSQLPDHLLRVRVEPPTANRPMTLFVLKVDREQHIVSQQDEIACHDGEADGPTLLLEPNGDATTFKWKDIEAFIPAYRLSDRRIPLLKIVKFKGLEVKASDPSDSSSTGSIAAQSTKSAVIGTKDLMSLEKSSKLKENDDQKPKDIQVNASVSSTDYWTTPLANSAPSSKVMFWSKATDQDVTAAPWGEDAMSYRITETLASGSEQPEIRAIQTALQERELYSGNIDGIPGRQTFEAIRAFQKQRYEFPSGVLTDIQRGALLPLLSEKKMFQFVVKPRPQKPSDQP